MIYETLMATVLFAMLWALRRHSFKGGWLFSFYLIFAGVERFLIEQIRVNNEFNVVGLMVTQAEVISVILLLLGLLGLALTSARRVAEPEKTAPAS